MTHSFTELKPVIMSSEVICHFLRKGWLALTFDRGRIDERQKPLKAGV
jgi:hypothetical protein